jgi:hypothetical protein
MYTICCYARCFGKFDSIAEATSFLLSEGWVEKEAGETLQKEMTIDLPGGFIHAFIERVEERHSLCRLVEQKSKES